MKSLWETHPVPYTHVHTDGRSKSVLDHFILSPRLLPLVVDCGNVERGDNRSRHCPIWVSLKLGSLPLRKPSKKWIPKRPAWSKATPAQSLPTNSTLRPDCLSTKPLYQTSIVRTCTVRKKPIVKSETVIWWTS